MKTLIIGASPKPERYSYKAMKLLTHFGHEVKAIGGRETTVDGIKIEKGKPQFNDIHTITIYIGTQRQPEFYDYIQALNPKRIIFNPGTENPEFALKLQQKGIEVVENCTLVMLSTGLF